MLLDDISGGPGVTKAPLPDQKKSPAELESLAQEVQTLLLDEAEVPSLLNKARGSFRRLYNALREMCSEMASLQLALAQAKAKIKSLEEQLYSSVTVLEVTSA